MRIVGERLRALREAMKMTQSQVGELLGVPQTSVFRYENGTHTPTAEGLIWYADYFDVSLDYIFGRTDKSQSAIYDLKPQINN